ncbi:MAG: hypothetical protein II208_04700 [Alphaproteobacteria bacterium]|nr:hypothetical protein [Alphaproteobacteria bacterium]
MNLKHLLANTLVALYRARHIAIAIISLIIPNRLLAATVLPDVGGETLRCNYAHKTSACDAKEVDPACYTPNFDGDCEKCLSVENFNGVKVTRDAQWGITNDKLCTCSCYDMYVKSFECSTGYYGTATSGYSFAGCTKCPSNATCYGGNNSTFSCNVNYYKSGNTCKACPSNATCPSGSTTFTCNTGYYVNPSNTGYCAACIANATCFGGTFEPKCNLGYYGSSSVSGCARCPEYSGYYSSSAPGPSGATGYYVAYGTTAVIGATSVSACRIPPNALTIDTYGIKQNTYACPYK